MALTTLRHNREKHMTSRVLAKEGEQTKLLEAWSPGTTHCSHLTKMDEKQSSRCTTFPAWLCRSPPPAASSATLTLQARQSTVLQLCPATSESSSTNFPCQAQHLHCYCFPPQETNSPTQPSRGICFPLSELPIFCHSSFLWSLVPQPLLAQTGLHC